MPKIWMEFTDNFGHVTEMFDYGCIEIGDIKTVRGLSAKIRGVMNAHVKEVRENWEKAIEAERLGDR